jgi:hypothetical protein
LIFESEEGSVLAGVIGPGPNRIPVGFEVAHGGPGFIEAAHQEGSPAAREFAAFWRWVRTRSEVRRDSRCASSTRPMAWSQPLAVVRSNSSSSSTPINATGTRPPSVDDIHQFFDLAVQPVNLGSAEEPSTTTAQSISSARGMIPANS